MPPQREWILVTSWLLSDSKQTRQRFQFVRHRDCQCDIRDGQRITRKARLIVLRNRIGNDWRFAIVQRVVAAHRSLQFRKFANHVGNKIGFCQQRGAIGERGVRANRRCDAHCEFAHARHPLTLRSQLVVIHHAR